MFGNWTAFSAIGVVVKGRDVAYLTAVVLTLSLLAWQVAAAWARVFTCTKETVQPAAPEVTDTATPSPPGVRGVSRRMNAEQVRALIREGRLSGREALHYHVVPGTD